MFKNSFAVAVGLLAFSVALCAALLAGDSAPLKDGLYKGSAKGYLGLVEVEVEVNDSKIAGVKILKCSDDRPKTSLSEIPKRIVAAQSVKVDAVTGATFTSKGVCNAADKALASARDGGLPSEKTQGNSR